VVDTEDRVSQEEQNEVGKKPSIKEIKKAVKESKKVK